MADRFLGKNHGWGIRQMSGTTYKGIVSGTSTNSTDIELRYTTGAGVTKEHIIEFMKDLETYLLEVGSLEVA